MARETLEPPKLPIDRLTFNPQIQIRPFPDFIFNGNIHKPIALDLNEKPDTIIKETNKAAHLYSRLRQKPTRNLFDHAEFTHTAVQLLVKSAFMKRNNTDTIVAIQKIITDVTKSSDTLVGIINEASFYIAAMQLGYEVYQTNAIWDVVQGGDFFVIKDNKFLEVDIKGSNSESKFLACPTDSLMQLTVSTHKHPNSTQHDIFDFPLHWPEHEEDFLSINNQLREGIMFTKVRVDLLPPPLDPSPSSYRGSYYSLHLPVEVA